MRVERFPEWGQQDKTTTTLTRDDGSNWIGCAIGPQSDESRVYVDGVLLQGGRVVPVEGRTLTITRVRPRFSSLPIQNLELALLEDARELTVETSRPDGLYSTTLNIPDTNYDQLVAPFCGRRMAKVTIMTTDTGGAVQPVFDYWIYGLQWLATLNKVVPVLLKTETPTMTKVFNPPFTPGGVAPPPSFWTYSFYVGGIDNAEQWDALDIIIHNRAGEQHSYAIDISTIGEMGAR